MDIEYIININEIKHNIDICIYVINKFTQLMYCLYRNKRKKYIMCN